MKKKLILFIALCFGILSAKSVVVPQNQLPQNSQVFIQKYFSNSSVALVKRDIDSFDVYLNDGTELEFMQNGEWKEIDGKYKAVPIEILPEIMTQVSASQGNAMIIEISKEIQGYKFKLNNRMKVYTDASGNILGAKFDD